MTSVVPPDLAGALGDRYDLRDVLGRGGMATVYMAYDRKHEREVALKVLRPDIAATIGVDRFLKEIQIVARMVHPHILSLHDSGAADGFVYYVMPYIDGGSMRQLIERERRLPAARAIAVAEPIADALSYAHHLGVLHRDIKPENVLFARNHPIVADFGIAKAVSSATSGVQLTRTGISMGTPGYMSPEQAAGFGDLDARTDVYSLAILVYEMIVGEIPGRWVTEDSTRAGRFLEAAASHRAELSAAGAVVEAALVRALSLRPDFRTATPAEFILDLKGHSGESRRKYRPDEIQAIVNRAAEIEATNPTTSGSLTIGGVEQIAREVGIDARHVQSALQTMRPRGMARDTAIAEPKSNVFLGGPTRIILERIIDGELSEGDYPLLVDDIRVILGELGQVTQLGSSFTWSVNTGKSSLRQIEVVVSVRRGKTRIIAQENLNNLVGALYGGLGGGLGGGGLGPVMAIMFGGLHMAGAAAGFFIPAWLLGVYGLTRSSYFYATKRRHKTLLELVTRLADLTRELVGEPQKLLDG